MTKIFSRVLILIFALAVASPVMAIDNSSRLSIMKEPAKLITAIYQDYHGWKIDEGLALSEKALKELYPVLNKDKDAEINDKNLKLKKVKQVASSLHTLRGMLSERKTLQMTNQLDAERAKRMAAAKAGKKVVEPNVEEDVKNRKLALSYSTFAVNEYLKAIEVDPANPAPHYQLGKLYAQGVPGGSTKEAEEELYKAAVLSRNEGDIAAADKTMESLKELNPKSKYIAEYGKKNKDFKGSAK